MSILEIILVLAVVFAAGYFINRYVKPELLKWVILGILGIALLAWVLKFLGLLSILTQNQV